MTAPELLNYSIGDVIEYQPFGGGVRRVVVTEKEANIKNGRAGFDGETDDGTGVWGYDDQIVRVVSRVDGSPA